MLTKEEYAVLHHLSQYVTENKKNIIDMILGARTRHITVVLENIFQSQNSNAVVRTCEGMGLQDIHIIENEGTYNTNRNVLKGSNKWVNLLRYNEKEVNNTAVCFQNLRAQGYTILATEPHRATVSINDINKAQQKYAIVFGNELRGLSEYALENSDERISIPMYGFTESYNISVSAAICVTILGDKLRSSGISFGLTHDEKEKLRLAWYRKIVKRSDIIEREFLRTFQ